MELIEFKLKEFLGDALLSLIVGELLLKTYDMSKFEKSAFIRKTEVLVSNNNLSIVAQELGMIPHPEDSAPINPFNANKLYANAYEAHVYQLYLDNGYKFAKDFVHKTLITHEAPH